MVLPSSRWISVLALPLVIAYGGCSDPPLKARPTQSASIASSSTTPPNLIAATLAGNVEEVRSLLQSGVDPNESYHTNTALIYAARDGQIEIAQLLIDHNAEVNWIDGEGVTPLILAAFKGHVELAELLMEHQADTTVRDQWNRTAMDYAMRRGETDPIVQLLQQPLD